MRSSMCAALAACLLAVAACQSTTVHGQQGRVLTATTPRSMTIRRGDSVPLQVAIDRENFTGPVTVSISQLPKGVEADRNSMNVETTSATFILKAAKTADLVSNQAVGVTVEDPNGAKALQYINLTVTD
jgi:hypothetical protein